MVRETTGTRSVVCACATGGASKTASKAAVANRRDVMIDIGMIDIGFAFSRAR
jgi:hypothetical protein